MSHDPEIAELTGQVRSLTQQAMDLSRGIRGALEELGEFQHDVADIRIELSKVIERRQQRLPYAGQERRRDER